VKGFGEREHSVADMVVLLGVVCLALVTWSCLADFPVMPLWKSYVSVGLAALFALAALTRHPHWAASIRRLAGGWMIAAPYVLKFSNITPALWAYLAVGTSGVALSVPGRAWSAWRFD
jgi:hypothetical protein